MIDLVEQNVYADLIDLEIEKKGGKTYGRGTGIDSRKNKTIQ